MVLYKELREEQHKKGFISLKNCTRCTYLNDLIFKIRVKARKREIKRYKLLHYGYKSILASLKTSEKWSIKEKNTQSR